MKNLQRFRDFVARFSTLVDQAGTDEARIFTEGVPLLSALVDLALALLERRPVSHELIILSHPWPQKAQKAQTGHWAPAQRRENWSS